MSGQDKATQQKQPKRPKAPRKVHKISIEEAAQFSAMMRENPFLDAKAAFTKLGIPPETGHRAIYRWKTSSCEGKADEQVCELIAKAAAASIQTLHMQAVKACMPLTREHKESDVGQYANKHLANHIRWLLQARDRDYAPTMNVTATNANLNEGASGGGEKKLSEQFWDQVRHNFLFGGETD